MLGPYTSALKIADAIVPAVFQQYVINRTTALSELAQSGIISTDPEFDALAGGGGKTVNMPYWNDLTGADEVLSDSVALTPGKISSGQDVAVMFNRGRAWGVNQLARWLAGSDPMAAIGNMVADYWARQQQALTLSMLKGMFLSASLSSNVNAVSVADVTNPANAVNLTANVLTDSIFKLGDHASALKALIVHSKVMSNMVKANLITFIQPSTLEPQIPTYMGKRVLVDDSMPVAAVTGGFKYTSYLFGPGAIALGNAILPDSDAVETDRDTLAGEDYLVNRKRFILHPRGVAWTSQAIAGSSPTNTECEASAQWNAVYDPKKIRIVQIVTNG